jgi:hypothetical protein
VEPGLARVLYAVQGRVSSTLFKDRTTVEIDAGHLSLIRHPGEVTQLIMNAVQAVRPGVAP